MRVGDAPSTTGTKNGRHRAGPEEREAEAQGAAERGEADAPLDSLGLSTRGFAGMLSELALGTEALLPAGSPRAVQRAFLEWSEPDLDDLDLVATAIAA